MVALFLGGYALEDYRVTIDYYDAIFKKKASKPIPLDIQTINKLRNILTTTVLTNPEGVSAFLRIITPSTHYSIGFDKPWNWYHVYKDYPDVFEHIVNLYYKNEYKGVISRKRKNDNSRYDSGSRIQPFSHNNSNSFINVYDLAELYRVKALCEFILQHKLDVCGDLLISLAYMMVINGQPQLAFDVYQYVNSSNTKTPMNPARTGMVQIAFYVFVEDAMKICPLYSLNNNFLSEYLDKNTVFSEAPNEKNISSVKRFIGLLCEYKGMKDHPFVEEMDVKYFVKVMKNLKTFKDDSFFDSDVIDYACFMPVFLHYVRLCIDGDIIELDKSERISVHSAMKSLMRHVRSNVLITSNKDKVLLRKLYDLKDDELDDFKTSLYNRYKLIVGVK